MKSYFRKMPKNNLSFDESDSGLSDTYDEGKEAVVASAVDAVEGDVEGGGEDLVLEEEVSRDEGVVMIYLDPIVTELFAIAFVWDLGMLLRGRFRNDDEVQLQYASAGGGMNSS